MNQGGTLPKRVIIRALACSLIFVLFHRELALCSQAQTVSPPQNIDKIKAAVRKRGVGENARVVVKLRNERTLRGYISKVDEDSFVLANEKTRDLLTISYGEVVALNKPGLSKGAKWGIFAVVWIVLGIVGKLAT
jgi:hypothetical protein